jgi:hypothetical protein
MDVATYVEIIFPNKKVRLESEPGTI